MSAIDPYISTDPIDVSKVRVNTRVTVPKWHRSEVVGWLGGTVIELQGTTFVVRLDDGTETIYYAYSLGNPK